MTGRLDIDAWFPEPATSQRTPEHHPQRSEFLPTVIYNHQENNSQEYSCRYAALALCVLTFCFVVYLWREDKHGDSARGGFRRAFRGFLPTGSPPQRGRSQTRVWRIKGAGAEPSEFS